MSEHELEHLLGGFAANTLTDDEKRRLYSAALHDQQLFNAMADEQALRELLADPTVRHRLLDALKKTDASPAGGTRSWLDWFRRPANLALAGGLATAVFAVVLGTKVYQDSLREAAQPVATEEVRPMAPPASSAAKTQPSPPSSAERMRKAKEDVAPVESEPAPAPLPAPSNEVASESVRSTLSARALYYGEPEGRDAELMTKDEARTRDSVGSSARQLQRLEPRKDQSIPTGKMAGIPTKPLGLRYSLIAQDTDGREREIDTATAAKATIPILLTVEVNQESYIQIWKFEEAPTPELIFPEKDSGAISFKMTAGQRERVPVPPHVGTLTIRVSRSPFGPITRQEAMLLDQSTSHLLQESVSPSQTAGRPEQAHYVVNPDLSPAAQLSATISLVP